MSSREAMQDFYKAGLGWILDSVPSRVREGRLQLGVNDVVIVISVKTPQEGDEELTASCYALEREEALSLFLEATPEAVNTIARLRVVRPVDECHVIVKYKGDLFAFAYALTGTDTVLN